MTMMSAVLTTPQKESALWKREPATSAAVITSSELRCFAVLIERLGSLSVSDLSLLLGGNLDVPD